MLWKMQDAPRKKICLDDFPDICRICLNSGDLKPLNTLAVYSIFLDIKHLIQKDELDQEFPNNICQCCSNDLENISNFLFRAKESEDVLKSLIEKKIDITKVPPVKNNKSETVVESKYLPENLCTDENGTNDSVETREISDQNIQEAKVSPPDEDNSEAKQESRSRRHYKKNKSFTCDYCGKVFERIFHLQEHINSHLGLKPFKCPTCGKGFAKRQTLTTHYSVHTGKRPFKCKLCDQSFLRLIGLSKHSLKVHNTGDSTETNTDDTRQSSPSSSERLARKFSCKFCNEQFLHRGSWVRHNVTHLNNRKFVCSSCDWTGNNKKSLYIHVKEAHGRDEIKRAFLCSTCGNSFATKGSLNMHMKTHTEEDFECNVCQNTFSTKNSLKKHLLSVHIFREKKAVTDPFVCSICSREFKSKKWLTKHEQEHQPKKKDEPDVTKDRKHTNAEKFVCNQCGKEFSFKCNMERHIKITHSGSKPFQCRVCGDKFTAKLSLNYHLNIHADKKPYQCEHCSKSFRQPSSLRKHILVHTGERCHKCEVCVKVFKTSSHLRAHMRRHM